MPISECSLGAYQSSQSRWRAVSQRDSNAHNLFIYGVISTKVYCRPTCTARLARRANILYYDTVAQARKDGYRPCKRCRPDDPDFSGERKELISKVIALLRDGKATTATGGGIKALAQEAGVTTSYLCRAFKQQMGVTIGTYMRGFDEDVSEQESQTTVAIPFSDGPILATESSATAGRRCQYDPMPPPQYDLAAEVLSPEAQGVAFPSSWSGFDPTNAESTFRSLHELVLDDFNFDDWLHDPDQSNTCEV